MIASAEASEADGVYLIRYPRDSLHDQQQYHSLVITIVSFPEPQYRGQGEKAWLITWGSLSIPSLCGPKPANRRCFFPPQRGWQQALTFMKVILG